jgi:hypothetical protein
LPPLKAIDRYVNYGPGSKDALCVGARKEEQTMRSGVSHKKQPPEMSITGGRNSPIDKGGEIVGGGEN